MKDIHALMAQLRRPRLLISAARFGINDYRRDRDLRRIVPADRLSASEVVVPRLMHEEAQLEENRKAGDASYNVTRHIDVLIALLAESRLLPRQTGTV